MTTFVEMDNLKETLFFELIWFEELDFRLAPINLIFLALCLLLYLFGKKIIWRSINKIKDKSTKVSQKRDAIFRLCKSLLFIVSVILAIESFNINHDHIHFGNFLKINLTGEYNGFQLSVYHLVFALSLFFVVRVLLNLFKLYLHKTFEKKDWVDEGKEYTIFQLVKYFVYIISIIALITSTGVRMNFLLTSAAALSVGLGLGLQTIFADYVSGVLILFEGTVKVGDVLWYNDQPCKVEFINIRTSKISTLNGETIVVPNSKLTSDNVINWSHADKITRFTIKIGVAYGSDTRLVEKKLIEALGVSSLISKRRPPKVFFKDFGENALLFELTFWGERSFNMEIPMSEIRFEIDRLFRENNIKIPLPQRDVHVIQSQQSDVNL